MRWEHAENSNLAVRGVLGSTTKLIGVKLESRALLVQKLRLFTSATLVLSVFSRFHYAAGVDQMTVYDDDSVDNTKEILQPFVKAGIVQYIPMKIG